MKGLTKVIIAAIFLLISITVSAADPAQQIKEAMGNGNASRLSSIMNDNIQLRIKSDNNLYSKSQSEKILNAFFIQHKPQSFNIQNTSQQDGGTVMQGDLRTENGRYDVYILLRENNGTKLINQIRIE